MISKFRIGLESLLRQGLSEPEFYGDLVYKLKKIVGSNIFSAQFIKIISHYKKIGYIINVLQQTACLVVNPITVSSLITRWWFRLYDGSDLTARHWKENLPTDLDGNSFQSNSLSIVVLFLEIEALLLINKPKHLFVITWISILIHL